MRRELHPGTLEIDQKLALDEHPSIGLSEEGSLLLRDIRLNALGSLTGISLAELDLGPELGRGSSSVVFIATYRCAIPNWFNDAAAILLYCALS